jgi:hypothetical protein
MANYLTADKADLVEWGKLQEVFTDITGAHEVEVTTGIGPNKKPILWVNVNGVCVLRICQIENLSLPEDKTSDVAKDWLAQAEADLQQIQRGTHDPMPTRQLPKDMREAELDSWWINYFGSQQSVHRQIAAAALAKLKNLRSAVGL